jgi:hypothetical protein
MSEEHREDQPEPATDTATEPVPEPATAVVTRAEIILDNLAAQQQRILDDQAALADQLRAVIDSQRLLGSAAGTPKPCANNCGISGRSRTVSTPGCALARTDWRASRRRRRRAESPLPDLLTGHAAG